jgi:hypothetical protein
LAGAGVNWKACKIAMQVMAACQRCMSFCLRRGDFAGKLKETGAREDVMIKPWMMAALLWPLGCAAQTPTPSPVPSPPPKAEVVALKPEELKEFEKQSPAVQTLLKSALALVGRNLKYQYGSANPDQGGLDCSGAVYYVLRQAGIQEVPRQANQMYSWVRKAGFFQAVWSTDPGTFELEALKPGDLMFWTGTYEIERDPPVTHVMIYLGKEKGTGKRVMVGASEGRSYAGKPRAGYSVFHFSLPGFPLPKGREKNGSRFIGYGKIPGLEKIELPPPDTLLEPPATTPLEVGPNEKVSFNRIEKNENSDG